MVDLVLRIESSGEPTGRDLRVLTAVLLLGAAQADERVEGEELTQVVAAIGRSFGCSDGEAGELMEIGQYVLQNPDQAERLLERVNERFDDEQREHLAAMVWRVILSDGSISSAEKRFIGLAQIKLSLSKEALQRSRRTGETQLAQFQSRKAAE